MLALFILLMFLFLLVYFLWAIINGKTQAKGEDAGCLLTIILLFLFFVGMAVIQQARLIDTEVVNKLIERNFK